MQMQKTYLNEVLVSESVEGEERDRKGRRAYQIFLQDIEPIPYGTLKFWKAVVILHGMPLRNKLAWRRIER